MFKMTGASTRVLHAKDSWRVMQPLTTHLACLSGLLKALIHFSGAAQLPSRVLNTVQSISGAQSSSAHAFDQDVWACAGTGLHEGISREISV